MLKHSRIIIITIILALTAVAALAAIEKKTLRISFSASGITVSSEESMVSCKYRVY